MNSLNLYNWYGKIICNLQGKCYCPSLTDDRTVDQRTVGSQTIGGVEKAGYGNRTF